MAAYIVPSLTCLLVLFLGMGIGSSFCDRAWSRRWNAVCKALGLPENSSDTYVATAIRITRRRATWPEED